MNLERVFPISAILVLAAVAPAPAVAQTVPVKFMTYNVEAPGWNQDRRAQIIATIDAEIPDVLGLHEASPFNAGADLLADLIADYEPFFADTRDPIYLRRARSFTVLDGNVEALPVCEGIPGGDSMLSWVEVETPEGIRFTFYSTHLCVSFAPGGPSSPEGNQRQAIAATEFMSTNTEPGVVHLLVGDLNANQTNPTIQYLVEGQPLDLDDEIFVNPTELDDTWEMAPVNVGQTHPGTTAGGGPGILDWILASPSAIVTDAEVIVFEIPPGDEDEFSDHYPVTAVLELSASSGIGTIPDGNEVPGELLTVDRAPEDEITLSWDSSCIPGDVDYHVYGGTLGDFYTHTELACTTGGATSLSFMPEIESRYYLVVATDGSEEGSYGNDSDGSERPPGIVACAAQSPDRGCE